VYLPAAEGERDKLPGNERAALHNVVRKLEEIGPDLPYPHSAMRVVLLACGSYAPGVAAARGGRSTGASAVTSSSPRSGPTAAKIREGSGRYASGRSGGSRSWKRNDHNGEAVRAAD
jgi:hypothetical protein